MRLGPGKHLKGLTLAEGIVKPEEYDYFHELVVTQEFARIGTRGYGDGMQVCFPPSCSLRSLRVLTSPFVQSRAWSSASPQF